MMKAVVSLVLLGLLCSSVIQGKPVEKESQVDAAPEVGLTVLENEFREIAGDGSYEFKYKTSDGAVREEVGEIKHSYIKVHGKYEFVGEDGETYVINYVADEKGFRPEGTHLPV